MAKTASQPKPRNSRWIWISVVILILSPGLVVLSVYSRGQAADRRLCEQLAGYRKRSEPASIADLKSDAIPDGRNAAIDLIDAGQRATQSSSDAAAVDLALPWTPRELSDVRELLTDSAPLLKQVRAARSKSDIAWPIVFTSPMIFTRLPLSEQRELANRVAYATLEAHARGDDAECLEYLKDLQFLARATERIGAGVVTHLVAIGIRGLTCDMIAQVAPDLSAAAPRAEVTALIVDLTDDAEQNAAMHRSMLEERVSAVDALQCIAAGAFNNPNGTDSVAPGAPGNISSARRFLLRPQLLSEAARLAEYVTVTAQTASQATDLPSALRTPDRLIDEMEHDRGHYSRYAVVLAPLLSRFIETDFRMRTLRHVTAAALAMRLYTLDNGGKLPHALDDLVPRYLHQLPVDSLAPGAPPLHFISDPADPRIYSVGANGTDDGGSEAPTRPQARADDRPPDRWSCLDAVFHYFRQPRRPGSVPDTATSHEQD
jgi:hypothetical protein